MTIKTRKILTGVLRFIAIAAVVTGIVVLIGINLNK